MIRRLIGHWLFGAELAELERWRSHCRIAERWFAATKDGGVSRALRYVRRMATDQPDDPIHVVRDQIVASKPEPPRW